MSDLHLTRIQWSNSEEARITVYSNEGLFCILTGPQASAFNSVIGRAFQAAEEARVAVESASEPEGAPV